jgi:ParB-like chromosome segregation protein Spo0J
MLEEGTYASMRDLARAEKISPTYISRLLRLTLLAPEIVEAVLDGQQTLGPAQYLLLQPISDEWQSQRPTIKATCP